MTIDNSKVAFSSAFRYERVALKGHSDFSVPVGNLNYTITIPHHLGTGFPDPVTGYSPIFRLFYSFGDGKYYEMFAGASSYNVGGRAGQVNDFFADTVNLYVVLANYGSSVLTGTVYYRIYAEPSS